MDDDISVLMPHIAGKRRVLLCGASACDKVKETLKRLEEQKMSKKQTDKVEASSSSASAPTTCPAVKTHVWELKALWMDISGPGPSVSRAISVCAGDCTRGV